MIDHPIERVWPVLRDFNSHWQWHPAVAESHIEDGLAPDQVGCVRNFRLADGAHLREQLLALSDRDWISTLLHSRFDDSAVPLRRHGAAEARHRRRSHFLALAVDICDAAGRERELTEQVGRNVYEAGFEALRRYLGANRQNAMAAPPAWSD